MKKLLLLPILLSLTLPALAQSDPDIGHIHWTNDQTITGNFLLTNTANSNNFNLPVGTPGDISFNALWKPDGNVQLWGNGQWTSPLGPMTYTLHVDLSSDGVAHIYISWEFKDPKSPYNGSTGNIEIGYIKEGSPNKLYDGKGNLLASNDSPGDGSGASVSASGGGGLGFPGSGYSNTENAQGASVTFPEPTLTGYYDSKGNWVPTDPNGHATPPDNTPTPPRPEDLKKKKTGE